MAREERKIIFSVQPYEDAKSVVGWIIVLVLVAIALISAAIYYIAVGVFAAITFLGYYPTWIWWYPIVRGIEFFDLIYQGKGSNYDILTGIIVIVAGVITFLPCYILAFALNEKASTSIGFIIHSLVFSWLFLLVPYVVYQIIF